jgi:ubiquitin-protein ligase
MLSSACDVCKHEHAQGVPCQVCGHIGPLSGPSATAAAAAIAAAAPPAGYVGAFSVQRASQFSDAPQRASDFGGDAEFESYYAAAPLERGDGQWGGDLPTLSRELAEETAGAAWDGGSIANLRRELRETAKSPPDGVAIFTFDDKNNPPTEASAWVVGPKDSPFEGRTFEATIGFPTVSKTAATDSTSASSSSLASASASLAPPSPSQPSSSAPHSPTPPAHYPVVAPRVRFVTQIYHPSISQDGHVLLYSREENEWNPTTTLAQLLSRLVATLGECSKPGAKILNPEAAAIWKSDVNAAFMRSLTDGAASE